jgi:hypothetical protein
MKESSANLLIFFTTIANVHQFSDRDDDALEETSYWFGFGTLGGRSSSTQVNVIRPQGYSSSK